ncbi:MAG: WG repeat-containing protein [Bacteroidia bacterium]
MTAEPDRACGLYDLNGKIVVPARYQWISNTDTKESQILILKESDHSYNFLNKTNQLILKENVTDFGYIHDQNLLLNPFSFSNNYLLYLKDSNSKYGLLNEITGTLDVPCVYDRIIQKLELPDHVYYSVEKSGKYGLINEKNKIIVPIIYSDINIDLINSEKSEDILIIASKADKYGVINLRNETRIPFMYKELFRISNLELFKAGSKGNYKIINASNKVIVDESFDEVANFELVASDDFTGTNTYQTLCFKAGSMRLINQNGEFLSSPVDMQPHNGYKSFDELKFALVKALDSDSDLLLEEFVNKIAPSQHILFYLKQNMFDHSYLDFVDSDYLKQKYLSNLKAFKHMIWKEESGILYRKSSLTEVTDFTLYRDGYITNVRNKDHAFGSVKYLEKILRNSIKVNGFWISTYFMKRNFFSN